MKEIAEAIDKLLSHIGMLLRYFAPGFAALLVLAAVLPSTRAFVSSASPAVVVLGMLLGPTIYGIHTGATLRGFWFVVVALHKKAKPGAVLREMCRLDDQRWLRRASQDAEVQYVQSEMDKWATMLNFLYCVGQTMILIPIAAKIYGRYPLTPDWNLMLFGGCLVLAATLVSEYRITGKEMRLTAEYPDGKTKARTTASMIGSLAVGSPP